MQKGQFTINDRFVITPGINSVKDSKEGKEVRLEPRLMEVLCFLATHTNQVVTREELVQEIWKDYGGGDEGLTQAISFLRKVLDDPDKTMIETIPKKGYILHAIITEVLDKPSLPEKAPMVKRNKARIFLAIGVLLIFFIISYLIYSGGLTNRHPDTDNHLLYDSTKTTKTNASDVITRPKPNDTPASAKNGPDPKALPNPSPN